MAICQKKGLQEIAKEHEVSLSSNVYEVAEEKFKEQFVRAIKRAKANGRKTVQGHKDF